jgi:hypothetical protein
MPTHQKDKVTRRPEGKEGGGAQQEGRNSQQAGQTNKRAPGGSQKHERSIREGGGKQDVEATSGNARDREMGREGDSLGDKGRGNKTWTPPAGEQGMSNRPDDD